MASPESTLNTAPQGDAEELRKHIERLHAENTALKEENAELKGDLAKARAEARIDELTGLRNRRALNEELSHELGLFVREAREGAAKPRALVIVDLDHFKDINDTHGHIAGDEVLKTVSALIQSLIRGTDTVARYGGEELAIILYDDTAAEAAKVAEKLRGAIEAYTFEFQGKKIPVRASFGVVDTMNAAELASTSTPQELLQQFTQMADQALYAAKEEGRNRVEVYSNNK